MFVFRLMKFVFFLCAFFIFLPSVLFLWVSRDFFAVRKMVFYQTPGALLWNFQSIDTMKYSRDLAREKAHDPSFAPVVDDHVSRIASTGATHVAIATPYDEEFLPFLKLWVETARKHNLNVWFRGNWSGWEGWFDYARISREEHTKKTQSFIVANGDLFRDGDIFSSCPECENGGPGDPRMTGDTEGYRRFLIEQYHATRAAFWKINKKVDANFFSMNGDVARLIMDKATTKELDGVVTIDHYVKTPTQLLQDVEEIAANSGGNVVLGEFGAPIPDIHGEMSEDEQSQWIRDAMRRLQASDVVRGVNYWTSGGSSTRVWNDDGSPRKALLDIESFYKMVALYGFVRDDIGRPIEGVSVKIADRETQTDHNGYYVIRYVPMGRNELVFEKDGHEPTRQTASKEAANINTTLAIRDKTVKLHVLLFFVRLVQ